MTLRKRLFAIFSVIALGTGALAIAGYLLALQFSTAIYEIGVVRFPSVSSLERMEDAARAIARIARPRIIVASFGAVPPPVADSRRSQAWSRFEDARRAYEPLPQTGAEAALWSAFVTDLEAWRAGDAELVRRLSSSIDGASEDERRAIQSLARLTRARAHRAIRQIRQVRQINVDVAERSTKETVATLKDAWRVQGFMLGLGILTLTVNLGLAYLLNRSVARPISDAVLVIRRITDGDLTARAQPTADDETGRLVESVNRLATALQNSEAARRAIGANLPRSIIYQAIYDPVTGPRLTQISPNVEQIAGIPQAALLKDPALLDQCVDEEDREALVQARAAVISTGKPMEITVRARNTRGQRFDFHITSATRRLEDGSIVSDGVITDVTERVDSERRLAALARTLRTIGRCRHAVVHATNETSLLQEVCSAIEEDDSYRTVWVAYRVDDAEKSVRCAAQAGLLPDFPLGSSTRWDDSPLGQGAVGEALRTGRVTCIEDLQSDSRSIPWRDAAETWGIHSAFAFPLKENGVPFAALAIYSVDRSPRTGEEVALLRELASDLEFGILTLRARKQLELSLQDLRVSEERFRLAMSQSPIGMSMSGFDGRWIEVNQALCDITGYSREELLAMSFQEITHPDDLGEDLELNQRVQRGELPGFGMQKRYIRKDGSVAWVEIHVTLIRDTADEPLYFVAQILDITARREAEEAALVNRTQLRIAAEVAGLYYWDYRVDTGRFTFDRGMTGLFGGSDSDRAPTGLEEFLRDLVAPEDVERIRSEFTTALRTLAPQKLQKSEYHTRRADGGKGIVSVSFLVERDEAGRPVLARGSIQDITEKEQMREQLAQVQKMEAVGQLAGGVAHDFNNFLTVILGYGQILASSLEESDRRHTMAAQIVDAAERSAALTAQLLAFSRREVLAPKTLDLNEAVHGIEKMLRRLIGENVTLVLSLTSGHATVRADPSQLQQVLVNLAVNARDAMPRGGRLAIATEPVDLHETRESQFATIPQGRYVRLDVTDNGTGIAPDVQRQMFEPFYTTKGQGKGTGLGLAVVYGAIRQSSAYIEVHSAISAGTTFSIYFPSVDSVADAPDDAAAVEAAPGGKETVMLVEDEESIRSLCLEALEAAGYRVIAAADGQQGLEAEARTEAEIDLLVTDVVMPRLGGAELAERMRQRRPGIKVLFVSGYTDDEVLKQGIQRREVAFLQKPYRMTELLRTVREVLDEA